MKYAFFAATAAAVVALGTSLAAAQTTDTKTDHDKNRPAATAEHQTKAPETSTKAQNEPKAQREQNEKAQASRDERKAGEEKRGAGKEPQSNTAQKPAATASTQAQTEPKRERNEKGSLSQAQTPSSSTQRNREERSEAQPNRDERQAGERNERNEQAEKPLAGQSATQPREERQEGERAERNEAGRLSQTRPEFEHGRVVSPEQRSRVLERFAAVRPQRVEHFSFRVSVGGVVPRSVRLAALPAGVAAIVPQFRGFRYVADRDRIVIVDPAKFRIVAVLPFGEGFMGAGTAPGVFRPLALNDRQRGEIRERIHMVSLHRLDRVTFRLAVGISVPPDVELFAMPPAFVAVAPELRPFRYVVVRDRFVVVDPNALRIVAIFPV